MGKQIRRKQWAANFQKMKENQRVPEYTPSEGSIIHGRILDHQEDVTIVQTGLFNEITEKNDGPV